MPSVIGYRVMQYIAESDGREYRIEVAEPEGSIFRISVDGVTWEVDCVRISDRCYSLLVDGTSYEVDIIKGVSPYTVGVHGEVHDVEVLTEREKRIKAMTRKAEEGPEGRQVIIAPMPSKVVRLLVGVGDQVGAGDGIIVVEAMKMENELRSAGPGTVQEIRVKEGEAVGG
ncbi:MAG: biotin/lipoyl-containing protein, partial [Candidatus Methylomirabilales bacterium]